MCGIAGFVAPDWVGDTLSVTRKMLAVLTRRGPDSEGLERWPGVALGHRRLAILDLSPAGHQPMLSDDGKTGVVFNGCIYNFLAAAPGDPADVSTDAARTAKMLGVSHEVVPLPGTACGSGPCSNKEIWIRAGALRAAIDEGEGRHCIPIQLWYLLVLDHRLPKKEA